MAVLDKMFEYLDSLSDDELEELLSRVEVEKSSRSKQENVQGLLIENGEVVACPHCGSATIVKSGTKDGKQRYKCKDCGKTFMQTTNTLLHRTRLTREQWKELLRGMVENLSISKIADNIGMSTKAVWYNKNKVLSMLHEYFYEQDHFKDIAECDEYSVHLSFKGKRDARFFIDTLGRFPRHHYSYYEKVEYLKKNGLWEELQSNPERLEMLLHGSAYLQKANRDSVCVLTGKDRSGNLFVKPVCLGSLESKHVCNHFDTRFEPDAIMVTDRSSCYDWFAEERNIYHEKVLSTAHTNGWANLAHINALHSRLSKYWSDSRENLPATKYLDLSAWFFWWLEKNSDLTTKQKVEELYDYISSRVEGTYTYDSLNHRPLLLDTKDLIPRYV